MNESRRPSFFWLSTEIGRAISELGASIPYRKFFQKYDEGDGHPVLVLPGFMATDMSTGPLRKFVDKLGYCSYGWDLGRNYAELKSLELLSRKIDEIYEEHQEPVSLIGWSLGGVFARQLAKEQPNKIRQVITLGSPFRGIAQPNNATWVYNLISNGRRVVDLDQTLLDDLPKPAPVPTTAIYTKEDGVVHWETCVEEEEDWLHQNVQVRGSHLGLGVNPSVLKIIADRLQYTESVWEHFYPRNMVEDVLLYPSL